MDEGGPMSDERWLPIKFGPVSNGEFLPVPHGPLLRESIRRTHVLADDHARRLGISRRRFLLGASGAAATLFTLAACSSEEAAFRGTFPKPEQNVPFTNFERRIVAQRSRLPDTRGRNVCRRLVRGLPLTG